MATTDFSTGTLIEATWLNDVDEHTYDQVADLHTAANITNVPAGALVATTVQAALNELDGDITTVAGSVTDHLNDTVAAHAASAISNTPTGSIAATTVQAAIDELASEKQPLDATLTALAGTLTAANKIPYATALDTASELDFKDEDDMVSNSATALPSQQSVKAYVDTQIAATLVRGTSVNASGTAVGFTGIPSGTKRITLMMYNISTNGTSHPLVQIGDSGGYETSGYVATGVLTYEAAAVSGVAYTTGFGILSGNAANIITGTLVLTLVSSTNNSWVASGTLSLTNALGIIDVGGGKALTATLDRIQLTTVNGTDSFDGGVVNILYE